MELEMDLIDIKSYKGQERISKIREFQDYKENLIHEYLRIQDILDEYNEKVNTICCEIEKINMILTEMNKKKY